MAKKEKGDDLCDLCFSSQVHVYRTTCCGKTIGVECGCEKSNVEGVCGDPGCEDCAKGVMNDDSMEEA